MNNEYLFLSGSNPDARDKGGAEGRSFAQMCAKNEQCTEGDLLLFPLILFHRFGGDGSGGFEGVSGLDAGGGGGDGSPCFAARHAEGDGATGQERKDDRLNDFVNLLVAHRFQCMWVRYVVVPARGCWSVGCKGHGW